MTKKVPAKKAAKYDRRAEALRSFLRISREQSNVTQAQLGEHIGQDQTVISKIESGTREISVPEFIDLCRALQKDPATVIRELEGT